jgi:hypothetical protein
MQLRILPRLLDGNGHAKPRKDEARMRKIAILIGVLAIACAARAQEKTAMWENLNILQAGEPIQVRQMDWTKVKGTFLQVSDTGITVKGESGPETIQRQDVRSVKMQRSQHRLRNALIVGGISAGAGAGIFAALHKGCPSTPTLTQAFCLDIGGRSLPAGLGAVGGLLGGGAVGALLPSHKTIYSVSSH